MAAVTPFPSPQRPHRLARRAFEQVSLSRQFLLAGAALLLIAMTVVGSWLSMEIEQGAVKRAAAVSAIYVESILSAQMQETSRAAHPTQTLHEALDRIFVEGPLHRKVVRFKLWSPGGTILYSSDHNQLGQYFPIEATLAAAFSGKAHGHITWLEGEEHTDERRQWTRLLEVYVPVRLEPQGKVVAVAEFYHTTENIDREIRSAQWRSWGLVVVATTAILLLLFGMVRRVDDTLLQQRDDLHQRLQQLSAAFAENERMRARLGEAGAATTALNERLLHRVAADLHDGPAQTLAFALMRFDELVGACGGCDKSEQGPSPDLQTIRGALRNSLDDLRNIAAGIGIPGIAPLSLADTARRAVREFERQSGLRIAAEIDDTLHEADMATKITVYRLLQESLSNSRRHAAGGPPRAKVWREGHCVHLEVSDSGTGFNPEATADSGRLGLVFMQERVRLIGGDFELESAPGQGTRVHASLPLTGEGAA